MSMTDERTASSNQRSAKQNTDKTSGNGSAPSGGGLPGLAAFGQMQGYKPVGQQAEPAAEPKSDPVPEPALTAEPEAEEAEADYAAQFAQDFVRDFNQKPQPDDHLADVEQSVEASLDADDNEGHGGFSSEEIQNYMTQQNAALEAEDYDRIEDGFSADATLSDPAPYETGNSLKTFEARYDQHPEIPLDTFHEPGNAQPDQPFFNEPEPGSDADFLGGESASEVAQPKERRGRKALMAASGLIGVLALGGALAFAYKIGGDSDIARTGGAPLIQADSRPVKVAPDKPGGKEFPHANKKIYERLGGDKSEEVVKIQPRQEDVAAAATAAISGSGEPAQAGSSSDGVLGGPRKVKTLTVRPDGTIEAPAADSRQKVITAPASNDVVARASDGTISMKFPTAPSGGSAQSVQDATPPPVAPTIPKPAVVTAPPAVPQQAAAAPAPVVSAPPPVQKPAAPRVAAVAPAAPVATGSGDYVVQVAARKSQTDALAAFADIQQKYPRLLDGYRPIIKRADLGNKGIWYRLNVGPVESKSVASSLCGQLKSAGMRSCLVRAQ